MNKIWVLPESLRNKIAAGEVVERPASILKELVENAIDAGSTRIRVDVEQGGRRLIRVTDNGYGMTRQDALLALERHATSKLLKEIDLEQIQTYGFRGEALPSIASVARVRLVTALSTPSSAVDIHIDGGTIKQVNETAAPPGTVVEVRDLFYNTPARQKFMKSPATELSHIVHAFQRLVLPHPEVHFDLAHNGQNVLATSSVRTLRERVLQVMGQNWLDRLLEVSSQSDQMKLTGFISNPPFSFASRDHQEFFVNFRAVRSPLLAHALMEAYDTSMMTGRYPVGILFLEVPYDKVDVNVHPAKREIRFHKQQEIHDMVYQSIRQILRESVRHETQTLSGAHRYNSYRESVNEHVGVPVQETIESYRTYGTSDSTVREETLAPSILPLGQIDQTYIVAQVEGELHIVDQHAGHERLLFDRLMAQFNAGRLEQQPLLFSETMTLSPALSSRIREILPLLSDVGMEVEEFGQQTFVIRSTPALLGTINGQQLLLDLLDDLNIEKDSMARNSAFQHIMASLACYGAVKAHQKLGVDQMKELLYDLQTAVAPTCPHGRPIRVTYTPSDLEKLFLRK
jgi:DNA mismatch repair protein MutL